MSLHNWGVYIHPIFRTTASMGIYSCTYGWVFRIVLLYNLQRIHGSVLLHVKLVCIYCLYYVIYPCLLFRPVAWVDP